MSNAKQKILLIINPISGRKKAKRILYPLVDLLCRNDCETTIFTTTGRGQAVDIVKQHASEADKIICCGGDGTLNEIFTGLNSADLQVPIGYIPTGTTNDFAQALKLPKKTNKAIDTAINGKAQPHDLGKFNDDRVFSYVASFGAFTHTAYTTPQWSKNIFGHQAYVLNGILNILDIRSHKLRVKADDKEITGDFVFGSVTNSTIIAGLIKLPQDDISFYDGLFEVILIKTPKSQAELQATARCLLLQKYDENYLHFFKCRQLSFKFEEDVPWTTDGEFAGELSQVEIECMQGRARVIV